jgi:hypothetical protein
MPFLSHEQISKVQEVFPNYQKRWTEEEDRFVCTNINTLSRIEMETQLKRPWRVIINRFKHLEGKKTSRVRPKTLTGK